MANMDWGAPQTGWCGAPESPSPPPAIEWVETPLQEDKNKVVDIIPGWPWRNDPSRSIIIVRSFLFHFLQICQCLTDSD
jgi:hypothetical protein